MRRQVFHIISIIHTSLLFHVELLFGENTLGALPTFPADKIACTPEGCESARRLMDAYC